MKNNNLSSLPPEIGQLENLTTLYLGSNQLSSLPETIGKLKSLTSLDLRRNRIPEAEQEKIRGWLLWCEVKF